MIINQLWRKFSVDFYYLNNTTIKFAVVVEMNKTQKLLDDIEKLVQLDARVLVFSKSLF